MQEQDPGLSQKNQVIIPDVEVPAQPEHQDRASLTAISNTTDQMRSIRFVF